MIYPLLTVKRVRTQYRTSGGTLKRTPEGRHILNEAGKCMKAGGKVMLTYDEDGMGKQWVSGSLDWRPENA